jgi:hypothetical protein
MRHGKGLSIALLLLCMTGGAMAAGESAPVVLEEAEVVCAAPEVSTPPVAVEAPVAFTCPTYCRTERFNCLSGCNGDTACQQACNDAYNDCCLL